MPVFKSKYSKIPGTSYSEIVAVFWREYHSIQKRTPRRQPYIRSRYFKKDKIFVNQFWVHLNQKNSADRLRRLPYFQAAIDVIRNSPYAPEVMQNPSKADENLYRYSAETKDGEPFYVQIREHKVKKRKDFMSVFPGRDSKN